MKITGKITKIQKTETGVSKAGKEWKKLNFIVETTEQYNNLYCFELFGDKVDNFLSNNKVNSNVEVEFNVACREYQDKYYTTLQAWKVWQVESSDVSAPFQTVSKDDLNTDLTNDLPF